jgi:hypothetical protein
MRDGVPYMPNYFSRVPNRQTGLEATLHSYYPPTPATALLQLNALTSISQQNRNQLSSDSNAVIDMRVVD